MSIFITISNHLQQKEIKLHYYQTFLDQINLQIDSTHSTKYKVLGLVFINLKGSKLAPAIITQLLQDLQVIIISAKEFITITIITCMMLQ